MAAGARVIHFDVMDGHFVPPITIGPLVAALDRRPGARRRRRGRRPPDDRGARAPDRGLRRGRRRLDHLPRGGDPARQPHPAAIRELGCLAGVAINPGTPVEAVAELRGLADIVLCMTVNPGWGGQAFIESSPDKVARLAPLVGEARIEVDGGIDADDRRPDGRRRRLPLRRRLRSLRRRRPRAAYTEIAAGAPERRRSVRAPQGDRDAERCRPQPRDQSPSDLLPPGALGLIDAAARRAPLAPARQRAAAADGDHSRRSPRSGRRPGPPSRRPLAAAAQHGDHRDPVDLLQRRGSSPSSRRAHGEDLRRAARGQPRRRRACRRALRASAWSAPRPRRAARRGRGCAAHRPRATRSSRAAGSRGRRGRSR